MMLNPLQIALGEFGNASIDGGANNANVLKYFSEIGHSWVKDDDTPWCAAFLSWVLLKAYGESPKTLLARKFLAVGEPTTTPEIGDIVVLWRIKKDSPYGHCGLFIKETANGIFILGGNEDGMVKIKEYPKYQLLGYRKIYA